MSKFINRCVGVLVLVIISLTVCAFYFALRRAECSVRQYAEVNQMCSECPSLLPMVDRAMRDGTMVIPEYGAICREYPRLKLGKLLKEDLE